MASEAILASARNCDGCACETALWPAGTFWSAYCGNRDEAVEEVIDADPIAAAVHAVMTMRAEWTGTASALLSAVAEVAGERVVAKCKTWPDSPRALAGRLRRAATFLRKVGIEVAFGREGRARTRTIRIMAAPEAGGTRPSTRSASPATMPKVNGGKDFAADNSRTVADAADGRADDNGLVPQGSSAPTR